jgi:hypothetical protein
MLRFTIVALSFCAFAACNAFRPQSAVRVNPDESMRNVTWHATLTSPATLSGVVQMDGTASMAPTADTLATMITVNLSNASPGGLHPWEARVGQCDEDEGIFGRSDAYDEPLEVGSDGRAAASATVATRTPMAGRYFVVVRASRANPSLIVACGNFAAPSR